VFLTLRIDVVVHLTASYPIRSSPNVLRERDLKGWSLVLITALGSWGKPVGHDLRGPPKTRCAIRFGVG
jgi:hypothetical protein